MKKVALDIKPFTRIVWKSPEIEEKWRKKIRKAARLYNKAEWKTVKEGVRECGTRHVDNQNYYKFMDRMTEDRMFFKPIRKTAKYSGFSHKHITPENENYNWYGVICTDPDKCKEFSDLENDEPNKDHPSIGELLGFPECCQEAFQKRWTNGIIDPLFEASEEVDGGNYSFKEDTEKVTLEDIPPEPNQLMRYFTIRKTSHLPCSLDCEETEKVGKKWEKIMRDISESKFQILENLLNLPIKWDAYGGIVEVTTPLFKGITTTGWTEHRRIIEIKRPNSKWDFQECLW